MKKNWKNPEMVDLEISETAGGYADNRLQDGPVWQDEKDVWQTPIGLSED